MTDALEQQGMEALVQRHLGTSGTDFDLRTQLVLYEVGWAIWAGLEGREEAQFPSTPPYLCESQRLRSGYTSTRMPCGWRMETLRKPLQVGGGNAESPLRRRARGAAGL